MTDKAKEIAEGLSEAKKKSILKMEPGKQAGAVRHHCLSR